MERSSGYQSTRDFKSLASLVESAVNHDPKSLVFGLKVDPTTGKPEVVFHARCLEDALYIQWGMSIAGNVLHRQCQECPTWFEVHPGTGRPEKVYCSAACKMRASRRRNAGTVNLSGLEKVDKEQ